LHLGKLELLVPPLVIEEFERNRPRSEAAVTQGVLARLWQLRRELHEFTGEKHEHVWLEETEQYIHLVGAGAEFGQAGMWLSRVLRLTPMLVSGLAVMSRAARRIPS
jgi:hypothetical protein